MRALDDDKSGLKVYFLDVTPRIAEELLKKNIGNRDVRRGMVKRFASDIERGRWLHNGQPLHLTGSGIFGNGQHRLQAVIESGQTVRMLVVEGLSEDALDTLDEGNRKTPADRLKRRGVRRYKLASASLNAMRIVTGTRRPISFDDFWELYRKYRVSFQWALTAIPDKHEATWSSVYGALVMAHHRHPTKIAMMFADSLRDRARESNDPVRQFVHTIQNIKFEKNDYQTRVVTFQKVCAACRAYVTGEWVERLVASKAAVDFFRGEGELQTEKRAA